MKEFYVRVFARDIEGQEYFLTGGHVEAADASTVAMTWAIRTGQISFSDLYDITRVEVEEI